MKKLTALFLAIFLSAFQFVNAQEYHPLIEEGKSWDDIYQEDATFCADWGKRYFYTGEDTIIDNWTYSKLETYTIHSYFVAPFCPPYYIDTLQTSIRLLREDTSERKVYMYNYAYQHELIYDFSLQVGDTFASDPVTGGGSTIVAQIDEITLDNGDTRKRWMFEDSWIPCIEGIGYESGLFGDLIQFEWWSELMCVQKNSEQLWGGACYGLVGEDEIANGEIQIYPNPANDFIRISASSIIKNGDLKIYNSLGQLVYQDAIASENTVVDISGFDTGIYFVLVETEEGVLKEKLIVR
jgi:hypothetical protein